MSWAGSRGSREELRPPFDAAKHSAALTGSLQPFSLQSRPRQSSAPVPMDCRDRAAVPGVIWGSCDKGRQGRACLGCSPGAALCCSDLLSLPFPSFLLLIQPFPCPLAAVCPCGREPCRVPRIPSRCWNCRVQAGAAGRARAAAAAARLWVRAQTQCPAAPVGAGGTQAGCRNHPQPCPTALALSVLGFGCPVARRWLGEGTGGTCSAPGSKLPWGKCFGDRLAWPRGIPLQEGEFKTTTPADAA